ncbi:MAG: YihY/virulence factor BrkB family protein [Deltaproteobacteria bacterium]|nr:YihY/virulence factor BrkB family protein [Deltaproteobacteria bacterium]
MSALKLALLDLFPTLRQDHSTEMAAGMTFFLLFSIFPSLVFLVTFLPLLPEQMTNLELLFETVKPILPPEVYVLLHDHFTSLVTQPQQGLAIVSAGIALFSASRALVSLSRALNRTYRVEAIRSEWLRRLRSMGLTILVLTSFLLAVLGITMGDWAVDLLVRYELLPVGKGTALTVVRWPLLLLLASFLVQQLYFLLPDRRPRWRPITTGSVFAVVAWVGSTFGLRSFATEILEQNVAYGSLGSVAVVMAWLYLGCLALIVGATFNALIERGLPPSERAYGPVRPERDAGESHAD